MKLRIGLAAGLLLVEALAGYAVEAATTQPVATEILLPGLPDHRYVTLSTRPGVTQGFLLVEPPKAVASLVLFVGGSGEILPGGALARSRVGTDGMPAFTQSGLLMEARERLAAQGFREAIVDIPSDQSSLDGFRTTPEHAEDIRVVIAYLKTRGLGPVWLVGSSRGSVSAAAVTALLPRGNGADGLVLISSILQEAGGRDSSTVFSVPLANIRVPVVILHHEADACPATPFGAIPELVHALRKPAGNSPSVRVRSFTGGGPASGNPCGSTHHHGFVGQADAVVASISREIRATLRSQSRATPKAAHP